MLLRTRIFLLNTNTTNDTNVASDMDVLFIEHEYHE